MIHSSISLSEVPGKVALVIYSGGCNLNCPWCFNADIIHQTPMTFNEVINKIQDYIKYIDAIVLSGGEPTLSKDFNKIINYIKTLDNIYLKVNTNGVLLSKNIIKNIDYLHISYKNNNILRIKSFNILEYSIVYSSSLYNQDDLCKFYTLLSKTLFLPNILTISQLQTGQCLDNKVNHYKIPSRDELKEVAQIFQKLPIKQIFIETKEFGREKL